MNFDRKKFEDILKKQVLNHTTPSIQYVFFDAQKIRYSYSYGFADIQKQLPVSEHTAYYIYSITKTFTALAIMQLAQKREISIHDFVQQFVPNLPYHVHTTIHHLLTHTAGIPNPIPLAWIHTEKEHDAYNRNTFFENICKQNQKPIAKLGSRFSYSNLGYVFLGQIIEAVSGLSYEEYVEQNIIAPLKISSQSLSFSLNDILHVAKGYHPKWSVTNILLKLLLDSSKYIHQSEGEWKSFVPLYVNGPSYGGLIGNSEACIRYAQDLLSSQSIVLSEEYKKLLFSEHYIDGKKPIGMSLGWFTAKLNGQRYVCHAGGGGGFYSELRMYPDIQCGSIVFCNRTGISDERFLNKIDSCFLS